MKKKPNGMIAHPYVPLLDPVRGRGERDRLQVPPRIFVDEAGLKVHRVATFSFHATHEGPEFISRNDLAVGSTVIPQT
jgi:hypothetical protein